MIKFLIKAINRFFDAVYDILVVPFKGRIKKLQYEKQLHCPPILIGGCGRSGTTLLLSILSAHKRIYAIKDETQIFCPGEYGAQVRREKKFNLIKFYSKYFNDVPSECVCWCEKTPKNILHFEDIISFFNGEVKLIHIVRDGRDVVLSRHPRDLTRQWSSTLRWVEDVTEGLKLKDHPNVYTVRYEDLVCDLDATMKGILHFLGLEYDPDWFAEWYRYAKVKDHGALHDGQIKPLYVSSVAKWKEQDSDQVKGLMSLPEGVRLLRELGYLDTQ